MHQILNHLILHDFLPVQGAYFQCFFILSNGKNTETESVHPVLVIYVNCSTFIFLENAKFVFGIPTIRRQKETYLQLTLHFLLKHLPAESSNSTLFIIFIAETDASYVSNVTRTLVAQFRPQFSSGLLQILAPRKEFYPHNFSSIYKEKTLGDDLKRVHWRTKQNLDFAYLMLYARDKGTESCHRSLCFSHSEKTLNGEATYIYCIRK